MTSQPALGRRFLTFLGPLVVTNVLQALSGTANTMYIGRMLGVGALASVSGFVPLLLFFMSFVIGLGAGASILVGQAWGAGDHARVRAVAGSALGAAICLGLMIAVVGGLFAAPLMQWLGTPADVLPDAVAYARIMMAVLPVLFVSMIIAALLRGTGDTVTPLRALLVTVSIIVVATPALIRGWFGPQLGVHSGAAALLLANLASLMWTGLHLKAGNHLLAPTRALLLNFRVEPALLTKLAKLGLPTGLFFVAGSLADLGLLTIVNSHGSSATAAWGAVNQVMAYVQFPAISIAVASSVFAAQAIGASKLCDLDTITSVGVRMNLLLTGVVATLVFLGAPFLMRLFVPDSAVADMAASLLRISVWANVIFGIASVFTGIMRASGTVLVPTAISLSCLTLLLYPLGWVLHAALGLRGIWMAYPLTYMVALGLQAAYFRLSWRQRPVGRLV